MKFKVLVEIALSTGHHHIFDVAFQLDMVRSVFFGEHLGIQTIASDDPHRCIFDRIFFYIVDKTFDLYGDCRLFE